MSKKKVSLRLADDEIVVVGTKERWRHLINVYEVLALDAESPEERKLWYEAADWVRDWVDHAATNTQEDEWG